MTNPQIVVISITEDYHAKLISALVQVEHECPRGISGRAHLFDFSHRQAVDHKAASPRVMCMVRDAPRELKEMYPWLSVAQDSLFDEHLAYIDSKKAVK